MTFGEKIQSLRKQKGLSQEQLALQLNVSRQAVSKWELSDSFPDAEKIICLSELFNVSTDFLLKDDVTDIKENSILAGGKAGKYTIGMGIACILFSCISFFVVWILEKIYPAPIVNFNPETELWRVGLDNFVWVHGLENFMFVLGITLIVGMGLICHKKLKKWWEIGTNRK